jgi:hypothetical protein
MSAAALGRSLWQWPSGGLIGNEGIALRRPKLAEQHAIAEQLAGIF